MSTDDRDETITDRAAIRDSDEPSERGDFPYYDLGPATSETVAALDLDAIEGRARYALEWGDSANKEMILALVAEVRSLRAKVAAVEALATRLESLGVPIPRWYAADIRAALATGEGK